MAVHNEVANFTQTSQQPYRDPESQLAAASYLHHGVVSAIVKLFPEANLLTW